jgi:hypothetical protein
MFAVAPDSTPIILAPLFANLFVEFAEESVKITVFFG